jgi:ABC-2 type transport system ATP-binding protein
MLVLDEPSTGLDPVVRREILAAIIRTIAEEGRTVIFSSHLLDEVERVSDHVAMIDRGRVVLCGPLEEVKASHRRLTLRFDEPRAEPPALGGARLWEGFGQEWSGVCRGTAEEIAGQAAGLGARVVEEHVPSLDEIFVARVGSRLPVAVED